MASRGFGLWRWAVLGALTLLGSGTACATCAEHPFEGERMRIVSEQVWVNGVSMTIVDLPALDAATARERFGDFWRKEHREVRVASTSGIEVSSTLEGGCVYALQVPSDAASGMPARLVVSDLHRSQPALPRSFEWPPAAASDILSDTISEDGRSLNRLLSYRVDLRAGTAAAQCIRRLSQADWKIAAITVLDDRQVTFTGRKGTTLLDAIVSKDGSGSIVTFNFTEHAG